MKDLPGKCNKAILGCSEASPPHILLFFVKKQPKKKIVTLAGEVYAVNFFLRSMEKLVQWKNWFSFMNTE